MTKEENLERVNNAKANWKEELVILVKLLDDLKEGESLDYETKSGTYDIVFYQDVFYYFTTSADIADGQHWRNGSFEGTKKSNMMHLVTEILEEKY